MKKLKFVLVTAFAAVGLSAFAQDINYDDPKFAMWGETGAERKENMLNSQFLKEAVDNRNYDLAADYLKKLLDKCPKGSLNIYTNGIKLYKNKINRAETEEEKEAAEKKAEANRPVLDFVKETLGDKVSDVRLSKVLRSGAVCLTADGPMSLEMEKYFQRMGDEMGGMKAQRVLELNADHPAYAALALAVAQDPEKGKKYAQLLYTQALIIAGLPVEDTAKYTELVCSLMV